MRARLRRVYDELVPGNLGRGSVQHDRPLVVCDGPVVQDRGRSLITVDGVTIERPCVLDREATEDCAVCADHTVSKPFCIDDGGVTTRFAYQGDARRKL